MIDLFKAHFLHPLTLFFRAAEVSEERRKGLILSVTSVTQG
jgi:hypothetical protein